METTYDLRSALPAFAGLTAEHTAQWGGMTPQHMVEHLIGTLRASRGVPELPVLLDERRVAVSRRFLLGDQPLPRNVDNPLMSSSQPLQHASLDEAIAVLADEVDEFYHFYTSNPTAAFAHPFFGRLSFGEWIVFHRKHFRHHCEQFGLLQSATGELS